MTIGLTGNHSNGNNAFEPYVASSGTISMNQMQRHEPVVAWGDLPAAATIGSACHIESTDEIVVFDGSSWITVSGTAVPFQKGEMVKRLIDIPPGSRGRTGIVLEVHPEHRLAIVQWGMDGLSDPNHFDWLQSVDNIVDGIGGIEP